MNIDLPEPRDEGFQSDPLSHQSISPSGGILSTGIRDQSFDVSFARRPDGTLDMVVVPLGPSGAAIGKISFNAPSLGATQDVLNALFTSPGEAGDLPPGCGALEAALIEAQAAGLPVSSDMGQGRIGIIAEYGDRYTTLVPESEIRKAFSVDEVADNIYHIGFGSAYLMTSTFLRFQEHYESPEFRGKIFSLDEFKAWYSGTKPHGEFSYYEDWGGFNIPSYVFEPFLRGDFDPLTEKEKALLSCFAGKSEKYYVIGTYGANEETLRHETAHGLYYTNGSYRAEVDGVLDNLDLTPVEKHLEALGYHSASWRDECHAYIGDPLDYLEDHGIDTSPFAEAHEKLNEIYRKYAGA